MVEIRYGEQYEVTDLAGQSVMEAREQFKAEFGIPDKARARLNGGKINGDLEPDTILNDDDRLSFAVARAKAPFLIGALLLALAATGGVFAFGWINATTTLSVTAASADFAAVTANTTDLPTWTPYGFFKGSISGPKPIFHVNTFDSGYTGDVVVTVSIANADELVRCYRVLALKIDIVDSTDNIIDINGDETYPGTAADFSMLTMGNGAVDLFMYQNAADNYTVRVKSGFYISHVYKPGNWGSNYEDPVLFCEVAQMGS